MNNCIREPLLHFFLLGAAIFVLFALFDPSPRPRSVNAIVVSDDDARRLITQFEAVWRRRPSERELDHMISKFVREEVYVREALALGLDKDDAVIRRRLQMKMEFLTESGAEAAKPEDATLQAHLNAKSDRFAQPSLVAFDQILLEEGIGEDEVSKIKDKLSGGEPSENFARSSLLPSQFRLSPEKTVESTFGTGFFEAVFAFPVGEWSGPVRSPFGQHLVRVTQRREARLPALSEIRDKVEQDWRSDLSTRLREERFEALLSRYTVSRPDAAAALKP